MNSFTFNTAGRIVFGQGAIAQLGELVSGKSGRRVLLLTDPGLISAGVVDDAVKALENSGHATEIFPDVEADPSERIVSAATRAALESGADTIVGFGGGSSLDVAKLVSVLAVGKEKLNDLYGIGKITGTRLKLVLVPTTAGTGSEVTPISIVTTGKSEKAGVVSRVLLPDTALLDPDLTLGLPPAITAHTGIDAMVHAIEAHTSASPNNNPVSRALAREALRLLAPAIEKAVHDGTDKSARADMLLGSMLAGQAFANSPVAAVHALAYPIGGHYKVPHGLSNALVLPHVLRANAVPAAALYSDIAVIVFPELEEVPVGERAARFADGLAELSRRCGLPQKLRDAGIPKEAIELLTADAMKQTRLLVNNPRELGREDIRAIYEAAW